MTVLELTNKLLKLPPDAVVEYTSGPCIYEVTDVVVVGNYDTEEYQDIAILKSVFKPQYIC